MGLEPVLTKAGISHQRYIKGEGFLHLFDDDLLHLFLLFWVDAEVQFIVYLQNHLASNAFSLETLMDMNHCHLDDISCCTLDGGIDGISLSKASNCGIMRVNIWQIATTSE